MAAWWDRLFPAVLSVRVDDRSVGGAGMVSIKYRSRWTRVGDLAYVGAGIAAIGWALTTPVADNPMLWVPAFVAISLGATAFRSRKRVLLTDRVLGEAAASAGAALGVETLPGSWRITGAAADTIGTDLIRLHNWWTPQCRRVTDPAREQILMDAAGPALRTFLSVRSLPASTEDRYAEPDAVDTPPHHVGQTWPTLNAVKSSWELLPPDRGHS